MIIKKSRNVSRLKRHFRIRNKISGTPECPRLSIYISLKKVFIQLIDDTKGITLVSALIEGKNAEACAKAGKEIAVKAEKANIKKVVFDRSGYLYHGKVKALAEAAREAGLEF